MEISRSLVGSQLALSLGVVADWVEAAVDIYIYLRTRICLEGYYSTIGSQR